jgi:ribosomal protein L23
LFPVKVVKVNILNNPSKTRRTFGRPGSAPAWKKAIVTLRKGDTLETV